MKGEEGPAFKSEPGHRDSGEQLWTPGQVGQGWHEGGWVREEGQSGQGK